MEGFDVSILFPLLSIRLGTALTPQELSEGQSTLNAQPLQASWETLL